ncbi:MAG: RnfABCDGE type electron transport complex subunit G [Clostridia bacterium]|nr:RnfABCDGE type electron transport complex subunit G [Clostridia bacterium]MBQ9921345.1 RnfABCDGE type electron transport complex subunit G [Clostridia bacterium]
MQNKTSNTDTKTILGITVKLLVISMITALILSCVNALTADKIAENIAREKADAIMSIFPSADGNEQLNVAFETMSALYMVNSGSKTIGYAAEVTPLGFGGKMSLMIGVNSDGTLAGVKMISHSETPGLGNRAGAPEYLSQYIGKNMKALDTDGIDVITGSTVSSNAILDGVKAALSAYDTILPRLSSGGAK